MFRPIYYRLINRRPVPITTYEWPGTYANESEWRVDMTAVGDCMWVSTVFVGSDLNHSGKGPPLLFETRVFHEEQGDSWEARSATWAEAEATHIAMVARAKAWLESNTTGGDTRLEPGAI